MQEWDFEHWGVKYWDFTLETEQILIRRFIQTEKDALHAYLSDPEVVRFEP